MTITCELKAPRYAISGERVRLVCRVRGAPAMADIRVEIWRTRPGASRQLATVAFMASSAGEGDGAAQVVFDDATDGPDTQLVPVTLVATPFADGRPGAPDTDVVMVR